MPPFACLKEGDASVEERRKNKQCATTSQSFIQSVT